MKLLKLRYNVVYLPQVKPATNSGNKNQRRIKLYCRLLYTIANALVKQPQNLFQNCNGKVCCWFIYFHFCGETDTLWTLKNEHLRTIYNIRLLCGDHYSCWADLGPRAHYCLSSWISVLHCEPISLLQVVHNRMINARYSQQKTTNTLF